MGQAGPCSLIVNHWYHVEVFWNLSIYIAKYKYADNLSEAVQGALAPSQFKESVYNLREQYFLVDQSFFLMWTVSTGHRALEIKVTLFLVRVLNFPSFSDVSTEMLLLLSIPLFP